MRLRASLIEADKFWKYYLTISMVRIIALIELAETIITVAGYS
jgi:hypothetical protein